MKARVLVISIVVFVATCSLPPGNATAQGGRPWGGGYAPTYSYPPGGYAAPGGYGAPAGYGAPGGYLPPGGFPPPQTSGTAPTGYAPPGYQPPPYQRPYAYPSRGQNPQQVTTDQSECGTWASQQSGYNPSEPGTAAYAAASGSGPRVATLGQTVPGLFGGIERREERRLARRERRYQENVAYAGQQHDAYNRALDSCLSARGYTVR